MMSRNSSESNNSWLALAGAFEPPTHCLQGSCSAPELRQHGQSSNLLRDRNKSSILMALAGHLVAEESSRGRHVQRFGGADHRNGQDDVAGAGHERP